MSPPRLLLLGPPSWNGVRLPADRRSRLLAVLALQSAQGRWQPRAQLAALFWPQRPAALARSNLRKLLLELRSLALPGLEDGPAGLRWPVASDLQALDQALAQGDWAQAAHWARGPLLQGLDEGTAGDGFGSWLQQQRDAALQRWLAQVAGRLHAAQAQAQALAGGGGGDAIDAAYQALRSVAPQHAGLHHAWLRLAWAAGAPSQALAACRSLLPQPAQPGHRGAAPTAPGETDDPDDPGDPGLAGLAALVHQVEAAAAPAAAPGPAGLPPLCGRATELAQLHALLDGGARLITLLGAGGVGKSRLARQLLQQRRSRLAAAWWVALDDLVLPSGLPGRIAEQVDADLVLNQHPLDRLVRHWPRGATLLVLDGFEHLVDAAGTVQALLQRLPGLQVLVSSRERLDLADEHLLPLDGLGAPPDAAERQAVLQHPAVQLFTAAAQRLQPGLDLAAQWPALRALCQATDGLPLALELAAGWARVQPVAAIAQALHQGALPPAQGGRSLEQVFERSWAQLGAAERAAFVRLAVFHGGFTAAAAQQVAGVAPALLLALVDKCLLRTAAPGRFDRHALLDAQARARLQAEPALAATLQQRHGQWCLALLQQQHGRHGIGPAAQRAELVAERANLLAAWQGWVQRGDEARLAQAVEVMAWLHVVLGRLAEAQALLGDASRALGAASACGALLQAHQAWLALWADDGHGARQRALQALAVLQPLLPAPLAAAGTLMAWRTLAHQARLAGRFDEAAQLLGRALRLARQRRDTAMRAMLLDARAMVDTMRGRCRRAAALVRVALRINLALHDEAQCMYNELNLSQALGHAGQPAEALAWADAGLRRAQAIGHRVTLPYLHCQRAALLLRAGQADPAQRDLQAAQQQTGTLDGAPVRVWLAELQARQSLARGGVDAAAGSLRQGARLALAQGNRLMGAALVPVAAAVLRTSGRADDQAQRWLDGLLACAGVPAHCRAEALAAGGRSGPAARTTLDDLLQQLASDAAWPLPGCGVDGHSAGDAGTGDVSSAST